MTSLPVSPGISFSGSRNLAVWPSAVLCCREATKTRRTLPVNLDSELERFVRPTNHSW